MKRLRRDKRGVSNVIVVMLSLVLIVIIVANVILWSYQMNQLDLERIQERISLTNAERITRSNWFTVSKEYTVNTGNRVSGTYPDTWSVNDTYETFKESLAPITYNPSAYLPTGATKHVSGNMADLATNNEAYMTFRSYSSAFVGKTLFAHQEPTTIAGASYYQLRLNSSDTSGVNRTVLVSTTGRKLWGRFVYSLRECFEVPASTWTVYYRACKTGLQSIVHCDIDILIRRADGTVRATIATDVANSPNLSDSWNTVSATYTWSNCTVVDDTDFLEIDYYAHATTGQNDRYTYLRIDDSSLATSLQTRSENIMLPNRYSAEVELNGNSNVQDWQNLTWTAESVFTTGSVNVTLQLYNFNASAYSTSGNGYVSYVSSSTQNTDERKNQTITANPEHYGNSTGGWRMKIAGVKTTTAQFDLKTDWVEFEVTSQDSYRLEVEGESTVYMSTYPRAYIDSVEIQICYRATDSLERWFLKAYNWTKGEYSDIGFNSTAGDSPTQQFKYYSVNLTNVWQSYVQNNGTVRVKLGDAIPDANQTVVDIDFLGIRAVVDGVKFSLQNDGPTTCHIVAIWIVNSTLHKRYDANFFFNSGMKTNYIRADISLPAHNFIAKVITELGNIAVFRSG